MEDPVGDYRFKQCYNSVIILCGIINGETPALTIRHGLFGREEGKWGVILYPHIPSFFFGSHYWFKSKSLSLPIMKRTYTNAFQANSRPYKRAKVVILKPTRINSPAATVNTAATVKRLLNSREETKVIASYYQDNVTTSGHIEDLSSIDQGSHKSERVGDAVRLKKLQFTFQVTSQSGGILGAADEYNNLRCILFRWRPNSGAGAPVAGNILDLVRVPDGIISPYLFDQRKEYSILWDRVLTTFNTPVFDGSDVKSFQGEMSTKMLHNQQLFGQRLGPASINFVNDTNDGTGKLYALFISDSSFTPHPTVSFAYQLHYTDA